MSRIIEDIKEAEGVMKGNIKLKPETISETQGTANSMGSASVAQAEQACHPQPSETKGNGAQGNMQPYKPFPVHLLPERATAYVSGASKLIGCDPGFVALPVLEALATAIGNARRIRLTSMWVEPPILWAALVAESGTKKSAAAKAAMKPIVEKEKIADTTNKKNNKQYREKKRRYEKAPPGDDGNGTEEPIRPRQIRYLVDDTTPEALVPIAADNWHGITVFKDELAAWFHSLTRYQSGKGDDSSFWLKLFNAELIQVDRKTAEETVAVPDPVVNIIGCLPPGVLQRCLGQSRMEDGLAARFLFVMPPRKPSRWIKPEIKQKTVENYANLLYSLFALEPDRDENGDPQPKHLTFTEAADAKWGEFYERHQNEMIPEEGPWAAAMSKLEAYAARLILILHCAQYACNEPEVPEVVEIDAETVKAGIELIEWFKYEVRRVYDRLQESEEQKRNRQFIEWIERMGGRMTPDELRKATHKFKTVDEATAALSSLVGAGLGRWQTRKSGEHGGRPTQEFVLGQAENNGQQ